MWASVGLGENMRILRISNIITLTFLFVFTTGNQAFGVDLISNDNSLQVKRELLADGKVGFRLCVIDAEETVVCEEDYFTNRTYDAILVAHVSSRLRRNLNDYTDRPSPKEGAGVGCGAVGIPAAGFFGTFGGLPGAGLGGALGCAWGAFLLGMSTALVNENIESDRRSILASDEYHRGLLSNYGFPTELSSDEIIEALSEFLSEVERFEAGSLGVSSR